MTREQELRIENNRAWSRSFAAMTAIGALVLGAHELGIGVQHSKHESPRIHRFGDHHGSVSGPSERHLKQFTHEHGIQVHSIPDVVATQKDHGPVRVATIEPNK
jgi:hypothetical protein